MSPCLAILDCVYGSPRNGISPANCFIGKTGPLQCPYLLHLVLTYTRLRKILASKKHLGMKDGVMHITMPDTLRMLMRPMLCASWKCPISVPSSLPHHIGGVVCGSAKKQV